MFLVSVGFSEVSGETISSIVSVTRTVAGSMWSVISLRLWRRCPPSLSSQRYIIPREFCNRIDNLELLRNCSPLAIHSSWFRSRFRVIVASGMLKKARSSLERMKLNLDCAFRSSILLMIPAEWMSVRTLALLWISSFRLSHIFHEMSQRCCMSLETQHLLVSCPPFWRL